MGKNNVLLFLQKVKSRLDAAIECHERLGGLLRYYRPECFVAAGRGVHCAQSFRRCWGVDWAQ